MFDVLNRPVRVAPKEFPGPSVRRDRDSFLATCMSSFEDFHTAVGAERLERGASQRIQAKVPNALSCVKHAALDEGELTGRFRRVRLLGAGWLVGFLLKRVSTLAARDRFILTDGTHDDVGKISGKA